MKSAARFATVRPSILCNSDETLGDLAQCMAFVNNCLRSSGTSHAWILSSVECKAGSIRTEKYFIDRITVA